MRTEKLQLCHCGKYTGNRICIFCFFSYNKTFFQKTITFPDFKQIQSLFSKNRLFVKTENRRNISVVCFAYVNSSQCTGLQFNGHTSETLSMATFLNFSLRMTWIKSTLLERIYEIETFIFSYEIA